MSTLSSEPRFQVLSESPLTVWDEQEHKTVHLGSQVEARELAELLNLLHSTAKLVDESADVIERQTKVILRLTAKIDDLIEKRTVEEDHY